MKRWVIAVTGTLLIMGLSAAFVSLSRLWRGQEMYSTSTDPLAAYHLNESFVHRDLVSEAVSTCNIILGMDAGIVLRTSWDPSPPSGALPVYLVDADALPANSLCFVPDGFKCIFISSDLFPNLGRLFSEPDPQEVTRQSRDVVTILLLHECGHLHYGDTGSFTGPPAELNLTPTAAKDRELRADRFAAELLRKAKADTADAFGIRRVTAMTLMSEIILINFNFFGSRIVDLGATEFHDKRVFWDASLTHPNLAFRMLNIAADMDPENQGAQKNLQDFLDARKPPQDFVLYGGDSK